MLKAGLAGEIALAAICSTLVWTQEVETLRYRGASLGSFVCANANVAQVKMMLRSTGEQNRCKPPVEADLRDILREQGRKAGLAQGIHRMGHQLVADGAVAGVVGIEVA
jgi:hypothetical protein